MTTAGPGPGWYFESASGDRERYWNGDSMDRALAVSIHEHGAAPSGRHAVGPRPRSDELPQHQPNRLRGMAIGSGWALVTT